LANTETGGTAKLTLDLYKLGDVIDRCSSTAFSDERSISSHVCAFIAPAFDRSVLANVLRTLFVGRRRGCPHLDESDETTLLLDLRSTKRTTTGSPASGGILGELASQSHDRV